MPVKLIAFDIDYTLLDRQKRIREENLRVLREAAERGVFIVPATGRVYPALPEELHDTSLVRYCILGNGARLYDAQEDKILHSAEIDTPDALELFDFAEKHGLRHDCYAGVCGWMSRHDLDEIESFVYDEGTRKLIIRSRTPVENLREHIAQSFDTVMKVQMYFAEAEQRLEMLRRLPELFPKLIISSSLPINIEINRHDANKGAGLERLCKLLDIDIADTLALGDGLNDLELIETAGTGVAMANAEQALKQRADYITGDCDESGFADAVKKFIG